MRRPAATLVSILLVLGVTGCVIGAPPSRYWIENNSDITIVIRQPVDDRYLRITEVPAGKKVEVLNQVSRQACTPGFEIVDEAGKQLRAVGEICDGDTVVYP